MSRFSRGIVAAGVLASLTFGLSPAKAETLDHTDLCSPSNPGDYSTTGNNEYFPLQPGQLSIFLDDEDPEEPEGLRITVLRKTETLYKGKSRIVTRVVEEIEWVDEDRDGEVGRDEDLIEISRNYFAQTSAGTVCYFGEAVDIFEEDGTVSHHGAWRADESSDGVQPNAPGIIMPAHPDGDDVYLQEFAPTVAMDQASIEGFGTIKVGAFKFQRAMRTSECSLVEDPSCLDPSDKVYAPGKGLVQDGGLVLTKFDDGR